MLRERTATARGFGDDIKLPVLAKLMLAERFIPRLFEQIALVAAVHSDGFCKDLEALETFLAITANSNDKPQEKQTAEVLLPPDSAVLTEWKSSETINDWARLPPKLSGLDLRPYLFVTKDKRLFWPSISSGSLSRSG